MKKSIPVSIQEKHFPSMNKARLFYTGIMHRYQPGDLLKEEDKSEVANLMSTPSTCVYLDSARLTTGRYGKNCFEVKPGDRFTPFSISVTRIIREHALKSKE